MRHASLPWPTLAGGLLLLLPLLTAAQRIEPPLRVEPEARLLANAPEVSERADALLDRTLAAGDARDLLRALQAVHSDTRLTAVERDAVLHGYLQRLRRQAPGTAPADVLEWLAGLQPMTVIGHEEGAHRDVPLFNIEAAARGLANEWAWRAGYGAIIGSLVESPRTLARQLDSLPPSDPRARGMISAMPRTHAGRLDAIAMHCATLPSGCAKARAPLELARGNVEWLRSWLAGAPAGDVVPILRQARLQRTSGEADALARAALEHPDKGVAAWALNDLTVHLPKAAGERKAWGRRLVDLLEDGDLGAAAALQIARLDTDDWIEAAAARPLSDLASRRLELATEAAAKLENARDGGREDSR
jgi:hypothetical protein